MRREEPSREDHFRGGPYLPPSPVHPLNWHVEEDERNSTLIDEDGYDEMLEYLNFSDLFDAQAPPHLISPVVLEDGTGGLGSTTTSSMGTSNCESLQYYP